MKSSDTHSAPERIVDSLLAELAEHRLTQEIDDPIDTAAAEFVQSPGPVRSQGAFLGEVTRLVQHIYESGLRVPQRLSPIQARAEAVALLEQAYRSTHVVGYEAALLDATGPGDQGLELVLTRLTEIVKAAEREKCVGRVCADHLTGCSWTERCAIAERLVAEFWEFLPGDVRRCHPAQLADEIPLLINVHLDSERCLADRRAAAGFLTDP